MSEDSNVVQVASIAVFNEDGRLLFGKRNDNGKWTLPGGHLEDGETPHAGALRELKEETGIDGLLDDLGSEVVEAYKSDKKIEVHCFISLDGGDGEKVSSKADPDEECSEWRWVDVSDGLPEEIAGNLHSPKNVTLRLLGLQDEKLAKMALASIPVGQNMGKQPKGTHLPQQFDYSHVLPGDAHEDYRLLVSHDGPNASEIRAKLFKKNRGVGDDAMVGAVTSRIKNRDLRIGISSLRTDHRGMGFGSAMYEGVMAHAKNHLGCDTVAGGVHSTLAHKVHAGLSAKHGMTYKARLTPGLEDAEQGEDDDRFGSYEYALKNELSLTKAQTESDDVYRALQNPNIAEHRLAQTMPGFGPEHVSWSIHNKDHSGLPVIHNLDPVRYVGVMNEMAWTDLLANGEMDTLIAALRLPQGLASIAPFLADKHVQEAYIGRILEEKPPEAQRLVDVLLPHAPHDLVVQVFDRVAHASPSDVPVEHDRLLHLVCASSPEIQALMPLHIFRRFWETLVVPHRGYDWVPASAPLTSADLADWLADFDRTREPDVLQHLARMRALDKPTVNGVLDRLVKLPAPIRRATAAALAGNDHVHPDVAEAHALLLTDPMKKNEAIQDGIRRLPPGLYRLYRVACAVFSVWPAADDAEILKLRAAAWANDGELIATALSAVDQPNNPENRAVLKAAAEMMPMLKSETPVPANAPVRALSSSGFDVAEEISQYLDTARPAHLDGKHSKGSFFVDAASGTWFMKPGAGGTGPIAGTHDDPAPASAREAAFWALAQDWGLAEDTSRAEWISVGGKMYAAIKFLPAEYTALIDEMEENAGRTSSAIESYRQRGRLWQWAVLDWVAGNGDRHGHNLLVNPKGNIRLIDHGSAFAGKHFNPAHDCESFTPYYLRYTVPKEVVFNTLKPSVKLGYMPDLPMGVQGRLRAWMGSLRGEDLKKSLERFGIDPQPSLDRLTQVQQAGSDLAGFVNRLWAGF